MIVALAPPIGEDASTRDARHRTAGAWREVSDWLIHRELSGKRPRTLDDDERAAARLLREWPKDYLAEYTDHDLAEWLRSYSPKSRRKNLSHIRELFKWAGNRDIEPDDPRFLKRDPTERLPKISPPGQKAVEVFSDAEIELLTGLPSPNGTLMQILLDEGLRKSEARRLRVQHANLETHRLTIYGGKGDKDRVMPLTERVMQRIADEIILEGLSRSDYFWWCRIGGVVRHDHEIGDTSFHVWWKRCLTEAGVTYRNPHTTRHTFATRWLRRTHGNFVTLQRALGHSSIQTTVDMYGHLEVSDVAADLHLVEHWGG